MIEKYQRNAVFTELKDYCHLSKPQDFIEVTYWHTGEGFDVAISDKTFSLTHGQFQALQVLVHYK